MPIVALVKQLDNTARMRFFTCRDAARFARIDRTVSIGRSINQPAGVVLDISVWTFQTCHRVDAPSGFSAKEKT